MIRRGLQEDYLSASVELLYGFAEQTAGSLNKTHFMVDNCLPVRDKLFVVLDNLVTKSCASAPIYHFESLTFEYSRAGRGAFEFVHIFENML